MHFFKMEIYSLNVWGGMNFWCNLFVWQPSYFLDSVCTYVKEVTKIFYEDALTVCSPKSKLYFD